jgi:hypothetical protein
MNGNDVVVCHYDIEHKGLYETFSRIIEMFAHQGKHPTAKFHALRGLTTLEPLPQAD